jgi:hypothetical protein
VRGSGEEWTYGELRRQAHQIAAVLTDDLGLVPGNRVLLRGPNEPWLPHLYDPHWTLHAAAEQSYSGPAAPWPKPFAAGSRRPQTGRSDGPRPRLDLVRRRTPGTRHLRWLPGGA